MSAYPALVPLADSCAASLPDLTSGEAASADSNLLALLTALRDADPRFAFDREGRPNAIAAVREALPLMERDLFDAVIEDHACEVAALTEALLLIAQALSRAQRA